MSKDIDDLFSDKMENEIKSEIKKKRNRLNLKLIVISVFSTLAIVILGTLALNFASDKYINYSYDKDTELQELEYTIMHPNEYIGKMSCREIGYFKFESTYEYGKRLGNKVIYAGSDNYSGGALKNGVYSNGWKIGRYPINDNIDKRYSSVYGMRSLYFLYPYVHYGKYIHQFQAEENKIFENEEEQKVNDFHFLNEIDDNKMVEMALSFDKEYIYEDINKMIDNKLITFYWVDNNSEEEKQQVIQSPVPAFEVIGIKATGSSGEFEYGPRNLREIFKETVRKLKEMGQTQYVENINENNFKISGIIVVGSPEDLKKIQNNPMIKHAILGTVVDKY